MIGVGVRVFDFLCFFDLVAELGSEEDEEGVALEVGREGVEGVVARFLFDLLLPEVEGGVEEEGVGIELDFLAMMLSSKLESVLVSVSEFALFSSFFVLLFVLSVGGWLFVSAVELFPLFLVLLFCLVSFVGGMSMSEASFGLSEVFPFSFLWRLLVSGSCAGLASEFFRLSLECFS